MFSRGLVQCCVFLLSFHWCLTFPVFSLAGTDIQVLVQSGKRLRILQDRMVVTSSSALNNIWVRGRKSHSCCCQIVWIYLLAAQEFMLQTKSSPWGSHTTQLLSRQQGFCPKCCSLPPKPDKISKVPDVVFVVLNSSSILFWISLITLNMQLNKVKFSAYCEWFLV